MLKKITDVINPPYITLGVQSNKKDYINSLHMKCSAWSRQYSGKSYSIIKHTITNSPNIPKHIQEGTVIIAVYTTAKEGQYKVL
jgi:hypothetical protein